MSIFSRDGRTMIAFECDGCGDVYHTMENDFRTALNDLKSQGWVARQINGTWLHACCSCQENEVELAL